MREYAEPYGVSNFDLIADIVVRLSRWVDEAEVNLPPQRDPEALAWHRVSKVAEEAGEAVGAMVAWSGGNPRKAHLGGTDASFEHLIDELLDTVIAGLGAVEHLTGNRGECMAHLRGKLLKVGLRAGVVEVSSL